MSLLERELRPRRHERLLEIGKVLAATALLGGVISVAGPATRQGLTDHAMDALIGRPIGWHRDPNGPVMVLSMEGDTVALLQCPGDKLPANPPSSIPKGCLVWAVDYGNLLVSGDATPGIITPGSGGEVFTQEEAGVPQE